MTRLGAWLWYALAVVVVAADQASKHVAGHLLAFGESVAVLPFLSWTLTCNQGAAFSLFQGFGWLLAVIAAAVSVYLAAVLWRLGAAPAGQRAEGTAAALIMGGAIGNLVDRLTHACVVDFIHLHYAGFHYPVFNIADSAITVGAVVWIATLLFGKRGREPSEARADR